MARAWKRLFLPILMPLMGGGDGVCGHEWHIMSQMIVPMCLAMMTFNENARA